MSDTHASAYFRGRGGRSTHAGTIWQCKHRRCRQWCALVDVSVVKAMRLV